MSVYEQAIALTIQDKWEWYPAPLSYRDPGIFYLLLPFRTEPTATPTHILCKVYRTYGTPFTFGLSGLRSVPCSTGPTLYPLHLHRCPHTIIVEEEKNTSMQPCVTTARLNKRIDKSKHQLHIWYSIMHTESMGNPTKYRQRADFPMQVRKQELTLYLHWSIYCYTNLIKH